MSGYAVSYYFLGVPFLLQALQDLGLVVAARQVGLSAVASHAKGVGELQQMPQSLTHLLLCKKLTILFKENCIATYFLLASKKISFWKLYCYNQ